jgi:hypothetical protein
MSDDIHDTHAARARQCNLCCIRDDYVGSVSNRGNARFSHCDKVDVALDGPGFYRYRREDAQPYYPDANVRCRG